MNGSNLSATKSTADSLVATFLAPAAAFFYPYWLLLFHSSVAPGGSLVLAGLALAAAFGSPLLALYAVILLERSAVNSSRNLFAKRLAYLACASPAIYTFTGVNLYMLGHGSLDIWLVSGLWAVSTVLVFFIAENEIPVPNFHPPNKKMRMYHGAAALALILAFVLSHLINHLIALTGLENQKAVMRVLRLFYRLPVVEPILTIGFLLLVASGFSLARRATRRKNDVFGTMQLASGIFLLFFLLSHMNAVFVFARRFLNIESDWAFATGAPAGLIHDPWNIRLLPLYFFSIVAVISHSFLGLRLILIHRGVSAMNANRLVFIGEAFSVLVAGLISAALIG